MVDTTSSSKWIEKNIERSYMIKFSPFPCISNDTLIKKCLKIRDGISWPFQRDIQFNSKLVNTNKFLNNPIWKKDSIWRYSWSMFIMGVLSYVSLLFLSQTERVFVLLLKGLLLCQRIVYLLFLTEVSGAWVSQCGGEGTCKRHSNTQVRVKLRAINDR